MWWKDKTSDGQAANPAPVPEQKGTRDLLLETLTTMGCQYEFSDDEDDDRIGFAYQGEYFIVAASNDSKIIHVLDLQWEHVELYDIDEFSRMKRAINEANLQTIVTTCYTIDKEGSNVFVHSKLSFVFIPEIPKLDDYLGSMLNLFFHAHHFVNNEMVKLRDKERAAE